MKNLLVLIYGFIFFASCINNDAPNNLISQKNMVNVLIDMHLTDASLDYKTQDSLLIYAKSKYTYLFKKHDIDSAAFSNSLNYYGKNSKQFETIYKAVLDSLTAIMPPEIVKIERFKRVIPDSLRFGTDKIEALKNGALAKKTDTIAKTKPDSLRTKISIENLVTERKNIAVKLDSTNLKVEKMKLLDLNLKVVDSLNTVKLLEIGIDF